MTTTPLSESGGRRPKFRKGQVVMVRNGVGDKYPVKLDHVTGIGDSARSTAWMDSLNNIEYEDQMRPLTKREAGAR